jgi:hypothetical protein
MDMMKKITIMLLCIIIMTAMFPLTASADIGPKPSVVIDFIGLEGKTYYATLLSNVKSTGPYSALSDSNQAYSHYQEGDKDYEIFLKYARYQDNEGFYFLQFFKDCTQSHQFNWTYHPPKVFKILLYFPETDSFMESDSIYERYAFDSYFTAEVSGISLSAETSYDYSNEILSLIVRIVLTIVAELGIALLFGFRERKQIRFITLVNVITQIALNFALNIINYSLGEMAFIIFYVLLELAVFITEAIIYTWYLKKNSLKEIPFWKPSVYALTANAASFALGIGLAYWIPGIF